MARVVDERTRALQNESSKAIFATEIHPTADMRAERARISFPVDELTDLIHGGRELVERRRRLVKILESDPAFAKEGRYFLSREDLYEWGLFMNTRLLSKAVENGISTVEDLQTLRGLVGLPTGWDLHFGMFIPTLFGQGNKEQRDELLPRAISANVIGTYVQTELGHGTYLRGLETTATYDRSTQEFIVHSPTITSTKWWPGGLAKTSNHIVLMARLFIDGKDYGPHAFFMQIRDQKTHMPLPGIEVGDIGPKLGFNAVDNGYLRFDHVRIPRTAMLMKYAQVTPTGEYVSPPVAKASYGTMVMVRSYIVISAASNLAKAVTIAIRYSAVRRQSSVKEDRLETQVLDYQTQQYQLFPLLAAAYALQFTGQYMQHLYSTFQKNPNDGSGLLAELHATSSGLKAVVTQLTSDGIEVCRKCCGGHGFHAFSALPILYEDYVGACTYEGENTVLSLQTARYLVKAVASAVRGEALQGNAQYLANVGSLERDDCKAQTAEDFLRPDIQVAAFAHRAAYLARAAFERVQEYRKTSKTYDDALSACSVDLVRASQAHCKYLLVKNFVDKVATVQNPAIQQRLKALCDLFVVTQIERDMMDFVEDGYLTRRHISFVKTLARALLPQIRPDAVGLVDAWDFSDYELTSALGRYDGNVYETMLEWARKLNPMNAKQTGPGYEKYLKPLFTAHL